AALELAIHRILKRDPGHAVHVTSEAKALVAVRAALDTAAPAHPAEGVHAAVIAGAIFDFAGYLTTLPHEKALHCSEAHEASPMVEAITEWCKRRGLRTDGARVETWRAALAAKAKQGAE
ncbi:hypothetical protein ACLS0R_14590, partial [Comamonas jiangduensis]|uniref:hypothetical protein n=1 Tax=Comamonas jiangduensis TaxID=1194168 RepID=UPI003BF823A0